ncbi:MAG: 2'-5' RNA ligase family protein [Planctomycetaceae bacterium]|nr:2'-5' RNA ligase family protein [Planctomycetales bacterium]MCB9921848.1 2'-5' RNA ligase family protein [Planctomycetaceae bacterium]
MTVAVCLHSVFTVWLKPEPTEPLLGLHAALWTAVSYEQDFEPRIGRFTPHLSVGQVRGRGDRDRLVEQLQATWKPVKLTLSAVHLISRRDPPDDILRVVHTIPLHGGDSQG